MAVTLRELLLLYRTASISEKEKGWYFERLVRVWLENAPTQKDQFKRVITFSDFAKERGWSASDTGIDLMAQIASEDDAWCAVQCKFYAEDYKIQKADIDSFFTASGKAPITRRLIVDSTSAEWGKNAKEAIINQTIPCTRIGLNEIEYSGIDWGQYSNSNGETVKFLDKKTPRTHQLEALEATQLGLAQADRGKLIMACGTGKTYTGLIIAQSLAGKGGRVLFLVPSLSLMSQTIREWSIDATIPLRSYAVCSDVQVGVNKAKDDDLTDIDITDLEIPATTSAWGLAKAAGADAHDRMTVVFSTYQSLPAVAKAQAEQGLPPFDLIICDEAHRTTGATYLGEEASNFVKVHDAAYIQGKKRIYMTATPKVYAETLKTKAGEAGVDFASMDDEAKYGKTLITRNFGWAVQNQLLTDYKVIVLAVDEGSVSASVQKRLSDENNELQLDDVTKIVGCYKALTKLDVRSQLDGDPHPMRRALAFCKSIKASKLVTAEFDAVASEWRSELSDEERATLPPLKCELKHVDGTFQANAKNERLAWLKEETAPDTCRILTNARCLTEGVDVPALDAVLFLHPRKSQIDVVQAVGRVMRRAPGKSMGYVILPIGIPAGVRPEDALNDNERYKVVWQILNALRSHDERLDATINKIDLGIDPGDRIQIISVKDQKIEVEAEITILPNRTKAETNRMDLGKGGGGAGDEGDGDPSIPKTKEPEQSAFVFDEFAKAIMAKIVKKCGNRVYWENWAGNVAKIAQAHIVRIKAAVEKPGSAEQTAFEGFLAEIRDDLNDAVTPDEAIEMLAQHMITKPVFDALFESYDFAKRNPVSIALEKILGVLDSQHLEKEAKSLDDFYKWVKNTAGGTDSGAAKQKIIVRLYDNFFKSAFPKLTQRMGIVYTPVEIVDFIIKSVEEVLNEEFGQSISDEGVHVIDPFTGTGTFITRLLQSGLIKPEDMARKFREEIHANEIVLLAYYIAAINIEAVFHDQTGTYEPFPGICLTDTFQMYEKKDMISALMEANSARRKRQRDQPITVIIGNPPYSAGQNSANDNAANVDYPGLDARIGETYAARSTATLKNALYDSYIRAIRWGSDRLIPHGGVMAFVTNAGWIDANTADGLRKSFADEFTSIDVFHLRGNQRTQGEQSRREGGKIFGQGSRTPVAITLLTLNPSTDARGHIRVHDIGDYLSREEKLAKVAQFASLYGITAANGWQTIAPDDHGDWLGQRDDSFQNFSAQVSLFSEYSAGVKSNRDAWVVNHGIESLLQHVARMLMTYNGERVKLSSLGMVFSNTAARKAFVDNFVQNDVTKISWSDDLKKHLARNRNVMIASTKAVKTAFRPFSTEWLYLDDSLNDRQGKMLRIFPTNAAENRTICVSGVGSNTATCFQFGQIPNYDAVSKGQNFPRYIYTPAPQTPLKDGPQTEMFAADKADPDAPEYVRTDAITDAGLKHFADAYPGHPMTKDDIFDYVYGILHHPTYRERYADNLTKQLPRIPLMKTAAAFAAVAAAGKALGDLHVNYETVDSWLVTIAQGDLELANIADPVSYWRVQKMKFAGKRGSIDKTTIIYNTNVTVTGIPLKAYDYVVNGKSAIDWVMERQCVKVDTHNPEKNTGSGITSDANAYATETVGDARYPFDLLCRIITVSMRTLAIVDELPPFDIVEG
jgi:predicted helicase